MKEIAISVDNVEKCFKIYKDKGFDKFLIM